MQKILILFVFFLPIFIYSNNWHVSTSLSGNGSGDSWANVARFSNFNWAQVGAGDTVWMDGGSDSLIYNINNYNWNLQGSVNSRIVVTKGIDTGHNGIPMFRKTNNATIIGVDLGNTSNVTFQNLHFIGGMTPIGQTYLIYFYGNTQNVTFQYCTIRLNYSEGVGTESTAQYVSDNIKFLHCDFLNLLDTGTNSASDMMWLGGANHKNWEIAYCKFINANPKTGATVESSHRDLIQCEAGWGQGGIFKIHHNFFDDRSAGVAGACIESEHLRGDWEIYNNIFKSNSTGANNTGFFSLLSLTGQGTTYACTMQSL